MYGSQSLARQHFVETVQSIIEMFDFADMLHDFSPFWNRLYCDKILDRKSHTGGGGAELGLRDYVTVDNTPRNSSLAKLRYNTLRYDTLRYAKTGAIWYATLCNITLYSKVIIAVIRYLASYMRFFHCQARGRWRQASSVLFTHTPLNS